MNEQNRPTRKGSERSSVSPLVTLLACLLTALVVFLSTFFALSGYYSAEIEDYRTNYVKNSDKYDAGTLEAALGLLDTTSLFNLPDKAALTEAMIEAAIAAMGDRYGTFFTDAEYASYSSDLAGDFVGIGVTLQTDADGNALVVLVHAGSPAEASGLLAGDTLVSVDGIAFSDGYDAAFDAIVGEAGSTVEIGYLRGGVSSSVTVTRAPVVKQTVVPRVEYYGDSKIGYVYISGFDGHTFDQFKDAVSKLESVERVDAFVFDVRSNGGGLLSSVGQVLAYLLPDGVIAYVDYRSDDLSDYTISAENGYVKTGGSPPVLYCEGGHEMTVPAVVLVNGKTASAAELFTASLRDYADPAFAAESGITPLDVAVFGTNTYGKGTVQTTYSVGGGNYLKLTLARYNPPTNVNYDGVGITPARTIEPTEDEEAVSVYLRNRDNDPQLAAALAYLDEKVNP